MAAGSRGRLGCHPPSFSYYRRDLRSVRPPQLAASFISSFRNVLADGYEISEYPKFWTQRPRNIGGPSVGGIQLNFHFNRLALAVIDLRDVHCEGPKPANALRSRPNLFRRRNLLQESDKQGIRGGSIGSTNLLTRPGRWFSTPQKHYADRRLWNFDRQDVRFAANSALFMGCSRSLRNPCEGKTLYPSSAPLDGTKMNHARYIPQRRLGDKTHRRRDRVPIWRLALVAVVMVVVAFVVFQLFCRYA